MVLDVAGLQACIWLLLLFHPTTPIMSHTADTPSKDAQPSNNVSVPESVEGIETFLQQLSERLGIHPYGIVFVRDAVMKAAEGEQRHVTAQEVAFSFRALAGERYGPLGRTVVEHWGIRSTMDIGRVVEALCEAGVLIKGENDRFEDFDNVYDFEKDFDYEIGKRGLAIGRR